ncbi:MAG: MurR/RpiR family transcriptional regulator [Proteobacteria bacterium]|nr:MurR/RpiR family transcriptional regulator [Pseudomonadota bacterium]
MASTPDTFNELRKLLVQIETGSASFRLGAASIETLKYMVENPAYTAVSTMTNIAKMNNVNPSTLTRLAYTLGYDKFSNFQRLFRDYVEENAHFYTTRANRLIHPPTVEPRNDTIFNTVVKEEAKNIESLSGEEQVVMHQAIVNLLVNARKVRFYGRRQFFSLAVFYSYCLGLIRERVDIMQDDVHGLSHSLTFMNEKDLVVVLGCAPYTKATVDTCRIANRHNIPIVSITDTHDSPLTRYALHHLIIPIESHFYSNSMAAAFAMAEGLLAMAAQQMGKSTLETLKKREQMIKEFGINLPHNT